ncbi:hypothetical protein J8I87_28900 [Paraburkholderia sp. LEh10]|uniref:hypothetical protein n=1 Tax=Paraburkholderia sp. LEh10 TaxID=2821353 RepID=UPI001AE3444B|nr:hypothetical protein [Paraburkholderia sp. LEh10]MBP0593636.1 hypothetical protein [Paraburkholderia sp. LEh10]
MDLTNDLDVAAFLQVRIGAANPFWKVTNDSNTICFGGTGDALCVTSELDAFQVARIRALGNDVAKVRCVITIAGERLAVYLVGRKVSFCKWRGVASANSEFVPTESMIAAFEEAIPKNVLQLPKRRAR